MNSVPLAVRHGFSFLSGLPEPRRQRRRLMPVQVFVDDSGGKGHSQHLVLCGLLSNSRQWADFSDEWTACLSSKPGITYFKMKEAAGLSGQFAGWSESQRDGKLRELVRIINKHALSTIYCGIDLAAHQDTWARLPKPRNDPYFWPFHIITMGVGLDLWEQGWRERFEIIFDEHVIFGPRAISWYPVIRKVVEIKEPDAHTLLPQSPIFKTDDEFMPLQAADLMAWCFRRNTNNSEPVFNWLLDELKSVSLSSYSQFYDRKRMDAVMQEGSLLAKNGEVPEALTAEFNKLYGKQ